MKKIYLYSIIIIAAINTILYYGLILPQKVQIDNILKEIEIKRKELIAKHDGSIHHIAKPISFIDLKTDIQKFNNILPLRDEMTKIIRELNSLAKESSLVLYDVSYESKKNAKGDIFPISFSFPLEGKYSNIKDFIYKLEISKRLITIDDLSLEKASGKEDIRLKIKVTAYLISQ